jgi:hypothetical protein
LESNPWNQDKRAKHALEHIGDDSSPLDAAQVEWHVNVTPYSQRRFTYYSDRLPALSGIAAIMARRSGDDYLAGLWKSTLMNDLAWRALPNAGFRVCRGMPSWSWASVSGHIHFPVSIPLAIGRSPRSQEARLVRTNCIPATSDPYGNVQSGASITLDAQTLDATLDIPENVLQAGLHNFDTKSQSRFSVSVDGHFSSRPGMPERPTSVQLLLLASVYVYGNDLLPVLILSRVDGDGQVNVYERVGLAVLALRSGPDADMWNKLAERRTVTIV